ncbi:hypothetical protein NSE01_40670 [Novosphingobium sediminis]|uniref:PNPLA domain-containing protein n=2 Tax=Novosphingobium sediminis TaxID=707214 RepID=A0A512AR87_9SPHN|nr:hypothetical protein NSE01_40670 [Novosphingobium sediminis]
MAIFAVCVFWTLRAAGHVGWTWAALAAAPLAAAAGTAFWRAGATPGTLAAIGVAAAVTWLCFYALRSGRIWERLPLLLKRVWTPIIIGVLIYLAIGLLSVLSPIVATRTLGSFAIFATFAGVVGLLASAATVRWKFGVVLTVYAIIATLFFGSNDHRIPQTTAKSVAPEASMAFQSWLVSRRDLDAYRSRNRAYPVILVSSEGGGIYAAAHAYGTLSALAQACPTFAQHLFATVGVSGGAIGNALFASSLEPAQALHTPCAPATMKVDPQPVTADHLSPVLARLLLVEPIDAMLPGRWMRRDRAQILTDSFFSVARNKSYLRQAVSDSFDPRGGRPALISVAVDVADGRRMVLAPFQPSEFVGTGKWWPGGEMFRDRPNEPQISVLDAAGVSARFPWITPTGRLRLSKHEDAILADGGYFDNSGADTVRDLALDLQASQNWRDFSPTGAETDGEVYDGPCSTPRIKMVKNFHNEVQWDSCTLPIYVLHLALASREWSDLPDGSPDPVRAKPGQSFLIDPISALLATRESRGEIALARADLDACGTALAGAECALEPGRSIGFFRNDISPVEWHLPLGWYMPAKGFHAIVGKTAPASMFDYRRLKREAEFDRELDTKLLIYHLDPDLYREDADPTLADLMPDP